jgi:cystathionine beta-lyase/cystathionine gamma-synthase
LAPALQLSTVYTIRDLDQIEALYENRESGFIYARDGHPNAAQLAAKIAALEGAEAARICASGMAAESAVLLTLLEVGSHVALSEGVYGKTGALVARELARFGVTHTLFDATWPETLREALTPATRLAMVETISNPLVRVADIPGLAEVTRAAGISLVVDHTFAPLLCRPLEMGAEVVLHSLTKLIGGHSDVTLGVFAGSKAFVEQASAVASTFGLTGNPFDCWLALRGLATLGVRSPRACSTALDLSRRLEGHPRVRAVHYPGLPSHPDHALARRLLQGGYGTIAALDLGGRAQADTFIRGLRHIPFAPSLADVSTTLSHPASTSHRTLSANEQAMRGITPGLVRLSFGLEDPDDLWRDMVSSLDQC